MDDRGKTFNYFFEKYIGRKVMTTTEEGDLFIEFSDRLNISVAAALICLSYYLITRVFFWIVSNTYRNMCMKDKMFWSLACVRGTYGFFGVLFSVYARCFENQKFADIISSKTELSYILILSHFGFFIFEWTAQIYFDFWFQTCNVQLHSHHLIAFVGFGGAGCVYDTMHYSGLISFILELSTPFSCVSYCLIKCKMADSLLWTVNQFVLVHAFHVRNIIEFIMIYDTIKYWDLFVELPTVLLCNWVLGLTLVFLVLTPYWTWKKTEQLFTRSDFSSDAPKQKAQ